MLFGNIKGRILVYSSPVMLISRKVIQDKRVVTDFRCLSIGIAKNNLAYPLLKDTFLVLGSSRSKVLSVLDLIDAFHLLRLSENSKRYCRILPYFGNTSYLILIPKNAYGIEYLTLNLAIIHKYYIRLFAK